jgi:hypothetical protein
MDLQRFEGTGSFTNLPHTGRPRLARKEENIERVEPVSKKNHKHQREDVLGN